jgi:hypothetical protein
MSSPGERSLEVFHNFATDPHHHGRWWPDEMIVEVLQLWYHIAGLNIKTFNIVMSKDPTYGPSIDLKEANETRVFHNARKVKTNSGTELVHRFYYILLKKSQS